MCVKNRGRAGAGGSAEQNGHNFLFCCIHGKGWHQSNAMSGTNNEDQSSATSSLTKTNSVTVTTASGKKTEDLSVTAMDQCQRNNTLMTNMARNKVFKCKKFTVRWTSGRGPTCGMQLGWRLCLTRKPTRRRQTTASMRAMGPLQMLCLGKEHQQQVK